MRLSIFAIIFAITCITVITNKANASTLNRWASSDYSISLNDCSRESSTWKEVTSCSDIASYHYEEVLELIKSTEPNHYVWAQGMCTEAIGIVNKHSCLLEHIDTSSVNAEVLEMCSDHIDPIGLEGCIESYIYDY